MDPRGETVTVSVELPRERVGQLDPVALSAELRVLWAAEQVRRKRCGVGKGAELAGVPRAEFMRVLGEHGIPVLDYAVDDLHEELSDLG
jgi:predicted HTH domain antitoxin